MKLKNLKLTLENVASDTDDRCLNAIETSIIYDYTEGKKIAGYAIACAAYHHDILKVKLPCTELMSRKIEELSRRLEGEETIRIEFMDIVIKPYALKNEAGNIVSGVSATADDFTIDEEVLI